MSTPEGQHTGGGEAPIGVLLKGWLSSAQHPPLPQATPPLQSELLILAVKVPIDVTQVELGIILGSLLGADDGAALGTSLGATLGVVEGTSLGDTDGISEG